MHQNPVLIGEKAAKQGMIHLILLGTVKLIAGLFTGMTVIIADAISTFADILGIFVSYMGLKLSRKNADQRFEYGYYKVETFAALIISIGIIYLAYYIFMKSLRSFVAPSVGEYVYIAAISTVISIVSSYFLAKKLMKAGKASNSLSLIASAQDKKMDIIAGVAVLISVFANFKQIPYIEGIVSIIIALFIFKIGIFSAKESLFFLLDYWNDPILTRKIRKILHHEKDLILNIKELKLRRAGTFIFGQAFVEMNPYADIQDLRDELNLLKKQIIGLSPYIKDFSIYTHISKTEKVKVAVPIKNNRALNSEVAPNLKQTTAYLFATIINNKIKNFYIKKLNFKNKKTIQLSTFIKNEKVNILIDNKLSSLVYYNLRKTNHILIYPSFSDIKKAKQTLDLLLIDS